MDEEELIMSHDAVDPVRPGYRTITPYLAVRDAAAAHEFYRQAFGAEVVAVLTLPSGRIMYGELRIGDSTLVVVDEMPDVGLFSPEHGGTTSLVLSGPDADGRFARAVAAGAVAVIPVSDSFSGDRHGVLRCPFGHRWIISCRTEAISDDEIRARWERVVMRMTQPGKSAS